jgi:hypothetical protein
LRELRALAGRTQEDVSAGTGFKQTNASRLEKRADMKLSTLRDYVESLCGTLKIVADVDGEEGDFTSIAGVGSGWGRNDILSSCFQRSSPVNNIWAQPNGEIGARNSGSTSSLSFRLGDRCARHSRARGGLLPGEQHLEMPLSTDKIAL